MGWLPGLKGVWWLGYYFWLHNRSPFYLDKVSIVQVQIHDLSSPTSLATRVNQQEIHAGSCLHSYCDCHLYPQSWPLLRPPPQPPWSRKQGRTGGVRESITSTSTNLVHFASLSVPLPPELSSIPHSLCPMFLKRKCAIKAIVTVSFSNSSFKILLSGLKSDR